MVDWRLVDGVSKFNIQIRDQITFTVANRTFQNEVGAEEIITRPREGDLIYMPMTEKVYVIKFAEHEAPNFYQLGALQCHDLVCELFEYSGEKLYTGIQQIDMLEEMYSVNAKLNDDVEKYANGDIVIDANTGRPVGSETSYALNIADPFADNSNIDQQDSFIDFTEIDPFSEGRI